MNIEEQKLAQKRFFMLHSVRISGVLMLALGLAVIANGLWELPRFVGYLFLIIGIFDFLVFPVILARRWKGADRP